jgi:hypothetical protein
VPDSQTLFRPIGPKELALIRDSGYRAFPPRLPDQPIFYPVLNQPYAEQIARDWSSKDSGTGFRGYVAAFDVDAEFLKRYDVHTVGAKAHQELWVPAEELAEFNAHIMGRIRVVAMFREGQPAKVADEDNAL